MNGYLLDTNVALLALASPERLSEEVRRIVFKGGRSVLSVLSYWEVSLKGRKGKLSVGDPRAWWRDALEQLAAIVLPLRPEHLFELEALPPVHQDPFDRGLIGQARAENLAVLTTDGLLKEYASEGLRIILSL